VTVTKAEDAAWAVLKPHVFAAIMDHFASGEPLLSDAAALAASDTAIHPDDDEARARAGEGGNGRGRWGAVLCQGGKKPSAP
jgi:hypothetical protein